MKHILATVSLLALLPAGAALADSDECFTPRDQWQSREAVEKMACESGWTLRKIKVDDGCYEVKGRDSKGRKIEVKLDPGSLKVVEMEHGEDDDDDDDRGARNNPKPAGSVAPPSNGLFNNGTAPKVKLN